MHINRFQILIKMEIHEIKLEELVVKDFVDSWVDRIRHAIGQEYAINALSGGVDSSVVTMLGHEALGNQLLTVFIDNGLMREGEPENIVSIFQRLGVPVKLQDAQEQFFNALKGLTDPEKKREAITQTFYKDVFGKLVRESSAKYLMQGTNYTDIKETVAGIKRQHNVLEQLGIDTQQEFGYKVIEPLIQIRKPAIRKVAEYLGLPEEIYNRMPFPGPALATRIIGEVTPEKVNIVRKATRIVEGIIEDTSLNANLDSKPFQYLAILHEDRVTGIVDGKRNFGYQIEVRCWDSKDAVTAKPTRLPYDALCKIANRITTEIPEVVSVTYSVSSKPPSTIEAI